MTEYGSHSILAVDLGTTTCMACVQTDDDKDPTVIIPDPINYAGAEFLPSAFCMTESGAIVGEQAVNKLRDKRYRNDVIRFVKRYMDVPDRTFRSGGTEFTPVQISGCFIHHLKKRAEKDLDTEIVEAVITVPAYFGNVERQATREAAEKFAGFDCEKIHLLDEPIAAAYGLNLHRTHRERLVLVADLGGGTFDVTLLSIGKGVKKGGFYELGRDGDSQLGGLNWDKEIAEIAAHELEIRPDRSFFSLSNVKLYRNCEKTKIELCSQGHMERHEMDVDFQGDISVATIAQSRFIDSTQHLAERCALICERLMGDVPRSELQTIGRRIGWVFGGRRKAKLTWRDIDQVLLVGGGCRVPAVKKEIAKRFSGDVTLVPKPQHQVAFGAARVAAELARNRDLFHRLHVRVPHSIGYWYYPNGGADDTRRFDPIIHRNTRVPLTKPAIKAIPVGGGRAPECLLEIVEEHKELLPRTNKPRTKHTEITPCLITGLPSRSDNGPETLEIRFEYFSDRDMKFHGKIRGKEVTVRIRGKEVTFDAAPTEAEPSEDVPGGSPA